MNMEANIWVFLCNWKNRNSIVQKEVEITWVLWVLNMISLEWNKMSPGKEGNGDFSEPQEEVSVSTRVEEKHPKL